MLLTVSAKASVLCGTFNIGSTKSLRFWSFGQNAQINLVTSKNNELMAGSQYPQTMRPLLKTELFLIYYSRIVFVQ